MRPLHLIHVILWALTFPPQLLSAADRPNLILILADDLGWSDLHCQGNSRIQTPALDALAEQGVRFTQAYAASPVCSPTRAALMTGLAPARLHLTQHGRDNPRFWPEDRTVQPPAAEHVLRRDAVTLATRLKAAGYATGFFGKWHLSGDEDPRQPTGEARNFWPDHFGFDVNLGGCGFGGPPTYFDPYRIPSLPSRKPGEYLTDRLADEAAAFFRAHRDQPVFICLWTYNPHYPFEALEERIAKYRGQEGPGLKNPIYAAQVESLDRAVGTLLAELDRRDAANDTLVVFTSDNGGWDGATDNQPLRSGKGDLYEGGLRVPLLIRWPKVVAKGQAMLPGTVDETPVISMDLTATLLEAAGVALEADEPRDGRSLLPLLQGQDLKRDALYFHYPHFAFHRQNRPGGAIRSGQYKLIRRYDDESLELFDLSKDLGETKNLTGEKPELAAALDARLGRWLSETNAQLPTRVP